MARIRTIKPEYWTDEHVGECSVSARLLFIATWNFADDHGGLDRSSKQLKAQAFPYDNIDCEPLVQELLKARLLIEYEANGQKYLHIKGFRNHQKVEKPAKPRIPVYEERPSPPRVLPESSPTSNGSSLGREGKGEEASTPPPEPKSRKSSIPDDFELNDERRTYAEKHLPDVDAAALMAVFRSTSKAKGWKYVDWEQHWQTLVRQWAPDSGHWSSSQYPRKNVNGTQRHADGREIRW